MLFDSSSTEKTVFVDLRECPRIINNATLKKFLDLFDGPLLRMGLG
jgi:hypothetical protein